MEAYFEVARSAALTDDPDGPPWSLRRLTGWMRYSTNPTQTWACRDEAGVVRGWYLLRLPAKENLDRAVVSLMVHPAARRRGLGTALLRHAAGQAAEAGRSVLAGGVFQDSAGSAFAAAAGGTLGLVEARRLQVISSLPAGRVAALRGQAERAATGYSLVSWDGRVPDEYVGRYATLVNAMADAPHDAGEEPEVWDADRVRADADVMERQGRRFLAVAARHDASGELAALTEVEPDPDNLGWGHQQVTVVIREHRGHRLGLLVKTAMLDLLAEAEPGLDRIVTGNAAVNQHMIAINEALGYRLLQPALQTLEIPVGKVLG
jgi:GNAT superfamily N-acetyltransferase